MTLQMMAAIDVGSSEVAMKVYQISPRTGIKEIDYIRSIVELGADTYNTGKLSYEAVDELCKVLKGFVQKMKEYQIREYVAYATSAVLEASNKDLVLDEIERATGLKVRAIGNAEQRFLILESLAATVSKFETLVNEGATVIDLSPGSLQVSVYENGRLQVTQNLILGSLRIREILADIELQTTSFDELLQDYISKELRTLQRMVIREHKTKNVIIIGDEIATVLNAVNASKNRESFTSNQFTKFYNKLMRSEVDSISKKYNIPYETATVLKPSIIIFKELVEMLDGQTVWASDVGLCDGILADYLREHKMDRTDHDFTEDIFSAADYLAAHYMSDIHHVHAVSDVAMAIFDGMKRHTGLGTRDRMLLHVCAILHDCGKYIDMVHGKDNAFYLIMNSEIMGISDEEKAIIANAVKYNAAPIVPKRRYLEAPLKHEDYVRMLKISAILRIANCLDHTHQQKVGNIRTMIKGRELRISTDSIYDITLEQAVIEMRAPFFEEIFGLTPVLRQKRRI